MFRQSDVYRNTENRGSCPQTAGGVPPTGAAGCAGNVVADAAARTSDPAGSIQEKGEKEHR